MRRFDYHEAHMPQLSELTIIFVRRFGESDRRWNPSDVIGMSRKQLLPNNK